MNIWTPKGMRPSQSCCKIPYKGYEISIAMDDSCGALDSLSRTDIRVYKGDEEVSEQFTPEGQHMIYGEAEDLLAVFKAIDDKENKT